MKNPTIRQALKAYNKAQATKSEWLLTSKDTEKLIAYIADINKKCDLEHDTIFFRAYGHTVNPVLLIAMKYGFIIGKQYAEGKAKAGKQ